MTKAELIDRLKQRTGLRKQELAEIVDILFQELAKPLLGRKG